MDKDAMRRRTMQFGLDVIRLVESLPDGRTTSVLGRQLLRSGTSVGANYRAACRAKSSADFISKMGTVEEESDEAVYWLEMLTEARVADPVNTKALIREGNEILAITVASIKTVRRNRNP